MRHADAGVSVIGVVCLLLPMVPEVHRIQSSSERCTAVPQWFSVLAVFLPVAIARRGMAYNLSVECTVMHAVAPTLFSCFTSQTVLSTR